MNLDPFINSSREELKEVEQKLASFDFSGTPNAQRVYEELSREHQRLTALLNIWDEWTRCRKELDEAREMRETEQDPEMLEVIDGEISELEKAVAKGERDLKTLILPPLPSEDRNIIVEIRPAAGGDEAGLFAADLFRMYLRLAERKNWKYEILEFSETGVGGVREATFSLQGEHVYRYMRFESGVHRVQRIPTTESGGRIHTSTVTVAVLPEAEELDVKISPEDLRIDVFRASGPGGQCVNTTDSAVRITHEPTGLSVASQQEKSQHRNREIAMRILRSRLLEQRQQEEAAKSAAARREQVGTGDRSERIRTYNFPQNRVTDHRFNITSHDLQGILEGALDDMLTDILAIDVERRLEAELTADRNAS